MDATGKALVQYKHDLIKAIKAEEYTAAGSILQLALAVCPDDVLLTELADVVQAKVQQDNSEDNSSEEAGEGASIEDETASDHDGKQQDSSGDESGYTSVEDSSEAHDDEVASSSSDDVILQAYVQRAGATAAATAALQALQPVSSGGQAAAVCYEGAQALQYDSSRLALAQVGNTQQHQNHVSCIQLAASCCTLTPQRRAELRQHLAGAIEEQKMAVVQQHLVANDPWLAAI